MNKGYVGKLVKDVREKISNAASIAYRTIESKLGFTAKPYLHPDNTTADYAIPIEHKDRFMRDYLRSERYKRKQELLASKVQEIYDRSHDRAVREKVVPSIETGRPDYSQIDSTFSTVAATEEAIEKGNYISRRIDEIARTPLEIYMYSLDRRGVEPGNEVVRDLYIAQEQTVTSSSCDVGGIGAIKSRRDIRDNLKMRILGWSHSHADFHTFFSGVDRNNISNMLESSGFIKKIKVTDPMFGGSGYKGVEYEVKYTTALVFNAVNHKPFVVIALEYTDLAGNKIYKINEGGILKAIPERNGIDLDSASLDKQILEKVIYNGRKLADRYIGSRAEPVGRRRGNRKSNGRSEPEFKYNQDEHKRKLERATKRLVQE